MNLCQSMVSFWKQDRSEHLDPHEAYRQHIEFWQKLIEGKNPQKIWQYQNHLVGMQLNE